MERIYGVVGDSLNGLTEALRQTGKIKWVHVRHEEVAAFRGGGRSADHRQAGRLRRLLRPGNLHLINGLYDAQRSRTPVLAIAAQIPSAEIGGGYFQETHPQNLFRDCSVYCELVSDPSQMPYVLENAIRAAVGERGVAVVVIPGDVALKPAPERAATPVAGLLPPAPVVIPADAQIAALADLLNSAERVTLFCGRGCAGAHTQLMTLAGGLKSPIVHALGGKEHVEYDNPYDVGMTGFIGFASGYEAMHGMRCSADAGHGFSLQAVPARGHQDRPGRYPRIPARRRCKLDLGIVGDVGATIEALLPHLSTKQDRLHLDTSLVPL